VPPPPAQAPAPPPPVRPPLLIDVTPLSLSVETVGGFADVLIDANSPVPCDRTRSFTTGSDSQTTVVVRVAQGESKRFADNTLLGELELAGLAAAARGEPQIGVTFEIDVDGILNVRARDGKTGREMTARMQLVGAQNDPAEIEAMRARQANHPVAAAKARR
jgi:molecular chaperone DnaK